MDVGLIIRSARISRGVTQQDLAERAGTTQTAISRLENNGTSPTIETLSRVLLCLGLQATITVEPIPSWTDDADLAAAAQRSPDQRIDHAVASMRSMTGLLGAARRA